MSRCSAINLILIQGCLILNGINLTISQDFPFDLSTGIGLLNQSSSEITSLMPNWFSYNYDGDGTYIRDGGNNMYDYGNRVTVSESGTFPYDVRYGETHSFLHSELSSNAGYPFITLLKVNNADRSNLIYRIRVYGNIGANGRGRTFTSSRLITEGHFRMSYKVFQVYGTDEPVICQVYFMLYNQEEWQSTAPTFPTPPFGSSTNNLDNTATFYGRPSRVVLGYVLLSRFSFSSFTRLIYSSEVESTMRGILLALTDFPFILSNALTSITESSNEITSLIPNWFSYNYDGDGTYILDGGHDMYDVGNRIIVRENSSSYIIRYGQTYRFNESIFASSIGYPFVGLLRVRNRRQNYYSYSIYVYGNIGANGQGRRNTLGGGTVTNGNYVVKFRSFQVSGVGNPTICEVYFTLYSQQEWKSVAPSWHHFSTVDLNNIFTVTGNSSQIVIGYVLLSTYPGLRITVDQIEAVMIKMLNIWVGTPINECTVGIHACHQHATCTDTADSYTCSCISGFSGNGTHCEDTDECVDSHNCDANAVCSNTVGSFQCTCILGFSGNGIHCEDTDECVDSHNCDANAVCSNTVGSFQCTCILGFSGNGIHCEDTDECVDSHNCDANAVCSNTIGSFQCTCIPGFSGNGIHCEDTDECVDSHNCDANAVCSNTIGSFQCTCIPGFSGNGIHCEDTDECVDSHTCDANAVCSNTIGSFQCLDSDECTGVNCDTNSHCVIADGKFTCTCNAGFSITDGSFCTADPTEPPPASNTLGIALGGAGVGIAVIGGIVAIVIFMKRRRARPVESRSSVHFRNQAPMPRPDLHTSPQRDSEGFHSYYVPPTEQTFNHSVNTISDGGSNPPRYEDFDFQFIFEST